MTPEEIQVDTVQNIAILVSTFGAQDVTDWLYYVIDHLDELEEIEVESIQ